MEFQGRQKDGTIKSWDCPRCKNKTTSWPALSRKDNKTEVCDSCGSMEALNELANAVI